MKHDGTGDKSDLRGEVAERLRQEVEQMNMNNFVVRPKRKRVEKYAGAIGKLPIPNTMSGNQKGHSA